MLQSSSTPYRNRLLRRLNPADLERIEASMQPLVLPQKKQLVDPNKTIETCFFLESGVASVTSTTVEGKQAEIGIIGAEGMVDIAIVLGMDESPLEVFMQIPGAGYAVPASEIAALSHESPHFRSAMLFFAHTFLIQISQSLLAALTMTLESRLSRWLLMSRDRACSDTFPMTHEFLSLMLGVRRAGVTDALNNLVSQGLIRTRRGEITIVNRKGLEARAGDSYALQQRNYRALCA